MKISRTKWLLNEMGQVPYEAAHRMQLGLVEARHSGLIDCDMVLLLEHPAVFTIGRRGGRDHLLISEEELHCKGIDIIPVERGGEITFHGPGQLVGYLIIDLQSRGMDIPRFVASIEEVMIRTVADYGVSAGRTSNPGVWTGKSKIGSIGLAVRHGISFHGFALNVTNDLEPFKWIEPCGLKDVTITTLAHEIGKSEDMQAVRSRVAFHIVDIFCAEFTKIKSDPLFALAESG